MEDKSISAGGKKIEGSGEGEMSISALDEAVVWSSKLLDAEFRGRKDTEYLARSRLAASLGIKESYLFRLQYKAEEMKDVAGSVYRALWLAYDDMCARNEEAADASRAERMELRKQNEAAQKLHHQGSGMAAPEVGTQETREH